MGGHVWIFRHGNYDNIYRLTNETISGAPANNNGNNGSATYTLDPVDCASPKFLPPGTGLKMDCSRICNCQSTQDPQESPGIG
jgi:hypothetical protein